MSPLVELIALVAPPDYPNGAGTPEKWAEVELTLGTSLPQDYKALVDIYGVGSFAGWINVYSPFVSSGAWNLLDMKDSVLGLYRQCIQFRPDDVPPFPPFPEPGGLLLWAGDENTCAFCWATSGPADKWIVVNLDQHNTLEDHRVLCFTATELLAGWFAGRITGDWYPDDIQPTEMCYFTQPPQ